MVLNTLRLNVEKDQAWGQTLEPRAVQEKTCNEVVCLSLLIRSTSLSCVAVHFPILSGDVLFFALSFSPFWHWWLTFWRWDLTKIVGSWFLNPGRSESKLTCSSTKHALGVLGGCCCHLPASPTEHHCHLGPHSPPSLEWPLHPCLAPWQGVLLQKSYGTNAPLQMTTSCCPWSGNKRLHPISLFTARFSILEHFLLLFQ